MSTPEISQVLAQMRLMAAQAGNGAGPAAASPAEGPGFGELLGRSIERVNALQQESSALKTAFERGEDVDLARVMVAGQKAGLAFAAMTEVRNKLVEAYKDVMNMPL